ncbi:bucentaur or craniofacial development-domain-containing protein [Calycina marina]|uniref:SWR1-complex protein 5 n=1 Tax=Calycina marina TaxID=1763456 RepID=A0A9P7ZAS0_9HELO|nr:bucentaur or craniofacial development-domain-containing protein [Calycina marina]
MPLELIPDDEDYASSEDSDFAPDAAPATAADVSSDEDSDADESPTEKTIKHIKKPAKRKRGDEKAEDLGFENSGDEAIIEKGLKRQKRRKRGEVEDEDEGGEGGLVKTRSMRAQEKIEKKPLASTASSTVDVDALWSSMISGKPPESSAPEPSTESPIPNDGAVSSNPAHKHSAEARTDSRSPSTPNDGSDAMIMIKRAYNFAGKVHTEQKLVPKNSAEAKLFLASQPASSTLPTTDSIPNPNSSFTKPKRPARKARRSAFEPVYDLPRRNDLHFGSSRKEAAIVLQGLVDKDAKKLNTVEKSAMDWAGFVDKAGIADELDAAGKAKGAYKARQEFLARVELKKDDEARRARGLPA